MPNTQMECWDGMMKEVTQWIIERLKVVSRWFQKTVGRAKTGHDIAGDTTTPEGRQGGPGRPPRMCSGADKAFKNVNFVIEKG